MLLFGFQRHIASTTATTCLCDKRGGGEGKGGRQTAKNSSSVGRGGHGKEGERGKAEVGAEEASGSRGMGGEGQEDIGQGRGEWRDRDRKKARKGEWHI